MVSIQYSSALLSKHNIIAGIHHLADLEDIRAGDTVSSDGRYSCRSCEKTYKNKHHLKRHENFECGQQKHFGCPICSKYMTRKSTLQVHLRTKHSLDERRILITDMSL
ncbi:hypothetical protein J6590_002399 [Homalodisca vitripennis]|nr:hypothetical protein J6590_002399 [Homalodisca vitripennis]